MSLQSRHFYEFGGFRIERSERLLRRDDEVVALPPKAIELLFVLLESDGRVLTKDELMSAVWADSFVEESNLAQNIFLLRKAFGEGKGSALKFIETVPRRGYRFVENVVQAAGDTTAVSSIERSLTSIVIEEQIEFDDEMRRAVAPGRLPPASAFPLRHVAAVLLVTLAVVCSAGFFYFRGSARPVFTAMRVTPVTSFADNEYEAGLSPDGDLVAFSWTGGETDLAKKNYNIYVKQPGVGGETLQITHNTGRSSFPTFSPDGRFIAYVRAPKKELVIVPALGGPERKVHEAIDMSLPAWSPDGKNLVFPARPDWETPRRVYSIALDTLEVKQLTSPLTGTGDNCASMSPDGTRLAFTREQESMSEIFVTDLTGGEPRQLTFDNRSVLGVTWTSDSSELVFASNRGSGSFRLWRISANGGEPSALAGVGNGDFLPTISIRGDKLAFHRQSMDTNVWRVPTDPMVKKGASPTAAVRILNSSQRDEFPAVSPDGGKIAFTSTQSGAYEIWLADADGTSPRQLTNFRGGYVSHPAWSPDGRSIAFDASPSSRSMIFVAAVDSGSVTTMTDEAGNNVAPSWSRDGKTIYFGSDRMSGWQVWKTSSMGGEARQVTNGGGYEAHESVDGKYLYYNKAGFQTVGIYRQDVGGSQETKIFDLPQLWSVGDWAVTEKGLYFVYRYDENLRPVAQPAIRFVDLESGRVSEIAPLPRDPSVDPGLSVSPDGKYLFYSIDDTYTSDIMLIENFH